MSKENHGEKISTVENSSFVNQSSLKIMPAESSSSKPEGTDEGNNKFSLRNNYFVFQRIF